MNKQTRLYRIEDEHGVLHWVAAFHAVDAIEVWQDAVRAGDRAAVPSGLSRLTRKQAEVTPCFDDDGSTTGTLWAEFEADQRRGYLGANVDDPADRALAAPEVSP